MNSLIISSLKLVPKTNQNRSLLGIRLLSGAVKSLKDIPGPINLPFIGSYWQFLPVIGSYSMLHLDLMAKSYYIKYGPIVFEKMGPINMVHLFDPKHFEIIANATFNNPIRSSFFALKRYREVNTDKYHGAGIFPSNNEEWKKVRHNFQKPVSPLKETRDSLQATDKITSEFVNKLKSGETLDDFMALAYRLNMELACKLLFDVRVGSFEDKSFSKNSFENNLISTIIDISIGIADQDKAEMSWSKYKRDKNLEELSDKFSILEEFVIKMINVVKNRKDAKENNCIIAQYIRDPNIHDKELLGIAVDLLMGSIHTTAITSSFLLYQVSNSPEVQHKLIREAKTFLPTPETMITKDMLNNIVYTRAVLKETFRINPVSPFHTRTLDSDLIIDGYRIPKDTMICLQTLVASCMECNFKDALKFKPERWLKKSPEYEYINPYLDMPFGLGLRSCLARRRAEQNLYVLVLRIFSQFEVKWMRNEKLGYETPFMIVPDGPVSLMFKKQ